MSEWVKDRNPDKDGKYLCIVGVSEGCYSRVILNWTNNLYKKDPYALRRIKTRKTVLDGMTTTATGVAIILRRYLLGVSYLICPKSLERRQRMKNKKPKWTIKRIKNRIWHLYQKVYISHHRCCYGCRYCHNHTCDTLDPLLEDCK